MIRDTLGTSTTSSALTAVTNEPKLASRHVTLTKARSENLLDDMNRSRRLEGHPQIELECPVGFGRDPVAAAGEHLAAKALAFERVADDRKDGELAARRGLGSTLGAGSAGHRRPVAPRSVRSTLVAPFATSWTTTHRFAVSRSNRAPGRGESVGQLTFDSQVLSPYVSDDDLVDATARTCRSIWSSDSLPAPRPCALFHGRASAHVLTYLALRVTFTTAQACEGAPAGPRQGLHACNRLTAVGAAGRVVRLAPGQLQPLTSVRPLPVADRDQYKRHPDAGRLRVVCGGPVCLGESCTVGILAKHSDYTCGSRGADGLRVVEQGVPHGDFA
jgi:hypothetical protein